MPNRATSTAMPVLDHRAIVAIFAVQAFAGGGLFPRIPDIQQTLGLSEAVLGFALMAPPLGGFGCVLLASRIVERFGTCGLMIWGTMLLAFSVFVAGLATNLMALIPALALFGVGFSLTNVAMNVEADRVEFATGRRVMNRCHGFWSLAMLAASLIGVAARGWNVPAAVHFAAALVLVALALATIARVLVAAPPRASSAKRPRAIVLPNGLTLRLVAFGMVGGAVQGATHNWSVIFLRDTFVAPDWIDTLSLPAFLLALTVGRLFGDRWTAAMGPVRVARTLVLIALLGAMLVIAAPNVPLVLVGFALMGVGTSIVFPLMISAAAKSEERPSSESVAAVTMTTGAAMMLVPVLIGLVAENFGVRWAFLILLPAFALSLSMVRHVD